MPDNFTSYIQQFQAGNHLIFEKIYQELSPKLYGVCLRYAADKDEAKDILQDSFIKIYHQLKTFRGDGSFEGWAKKITVNMALEYFRTKIKWQNMPLHDFEKVLR